MPSSSVGAAGQLSAGRSMPPKILVRFDARVVGIGFTAILDVPEVMEPAAQYVRDRLLPMIDGGGGDPYR